MSNIKSLFATRLYHAALSDHGKPIDTDELAASCFSIAEDDEAGQDWCEENGYAGYTSYASLDDLPYRFPIFKDLVAVLDKHVAAFAKDLDFDLGERKLVLDSLWLKDAREELRPFIYVAPDAGDVLLWESWLRHEVPMNMIEEDRVSVSFNYNWA